MFLQHKLFLQRYLSEMLNVCKAVPSGSQVPPTLAEGKNRRDMHCASEEGDRLGHVPTTGTDGGNEAPGACCRVKTWPRVRNWDRGFSLARVFPYPRLPIWLMRRCLAKASKASYPGVPLRPFPGAPCKCFSPPIHYDFGRSSGLALAARGAGGIRMTLTPTASGRGERSPNLTESRSSLPWKKHERCVWRPRNSAILRPR